MEKILEFVIHSNSVQMSNPAFMAELKSWIRFNRKEAMSSGDGLYSGISGNADLPTWLGKFAFDLAFKPKSENDKYAKHIRSSAGIAVFVSEENDRNHWVEVGRCFQRFALQATALGVRNALLNQPVEVSALRPTFAKHLGLGGQRPDLKVQLKQKLFILMDRDNRMHSFCRFSDDSLVGTGTLAYFAARNDEKKSAVKIKL
jgi:hypothetical protein